MEYKVLTVEDKLRFGAESRLEQDVQKLLSEGWKLNGGVSIAITQHGDSDYYALAQAMVK